MHYNLAKALLDSQNPSGAVDELKKAIDLCPEFEEAKELFDRIKKDGVAADKELASEISTVKN